MIWYVVFHPRTKGHWWARQFGHVSLAGFSNETWTQLDLTRTGVDVRTFYAHDEVQDYLSFLSAHHTLIQYGKAQDVGGSYFQPMTCVGFVKHTLGIRSRALSPDQLFAILAKKHDVVIGNDPKRSRRNC